jgi:ribose transport system permease protein
MKLFLPAGLTGNLNLRTALRPARIMPTITLILLLVIVGSIRPQFFSGYSLQTLASAAGPLILLACGEFAAIVLGGVDLSIGAVTALGTVLAAMWLGHAGAWLVIIAVLAIPAGMGALNGAVTVVAKIPSFITTLGTLGLWTGVALVISGAQSKQVTDPAAVSWLGGYTVGVPNGFGIAVIAAIVLGLAMRYLPGGRLGMYAVGWAEAAAVMSGLRVAWIRVIAFTLAGLFAGLAALVLVAQTSSGDPTSAASFQLPAIASVIVGGNAITGGAGSVYRTVIGACIITVIENGIGVVGISAFSQQIIYGAVLIFAAGLTMDRSRVGVVK